METHQAIAHDEPVRLTSDQPAVVGAGHQEMRGAKVLVPAYKLSEFNRRLSSLNVKALKFGLAPIQVVDRQSRLYAQIRHTDGDRVAYVLTKVADCGSTPSETVGLVDMQEIDLLFPLIRLGNWSIVAQLEATPGGCLLFTFSERDRDRAEALRRRTAVTLHCEHCHTSRQRRLAYVLRDGNADRYQQVGSTCLADFTGIDAASSLFLAKLVEFERYTDELSEGAASAAADAMPLVSYLASVLFLVDRHGFTSVAKSRDTRTTPTYQKALDLPSSADRDPALARELSASLGRCREEAASIIAWYREMAPRDDFDVNVSALLRSDHIRCDMRHLAIAAASVPGYRRHLQTLKHAADGSRSVHVGDVGQKLERRLRAYHATVFDGRFGAQARLSFVDDDGNRYSWRTAAAPPDLVDRAHLERPFHAHFKVKKHDEYRGVRTTEITHLRSMGWVDTSESVSCA